MEITKLRQVAGIFPATLTSIFLVLALGVSCAKPSPATVTIIPDIPANYHAYIEATPNLLVSAYFDQCSDIEQVKQRYDGLPFVFKNISVSEAMLKNKNADQLWVDGVIRCEALTFGAVGQLKAGDRIDVIGINQGKDVGLDNNWELVLTGCVFLPAGSVVLPAAGGATMSPID